MDSQVSPSFLLLWGLVLAPSVVVQHTLWLKGLQTAVLVVLALAAGRIRGPGVLLGSLVFVLATVAVNLLSPLGRLLLRLGPLRVTDGALRAGLAKALTVLALSYLSRLCVRGDLVLPGAAGRYLRLTFSYLNGLLLRRPAMRGTDLVGRIDGVLAAVTGEEVGVLPGPPGGARLQRTTAAGLAFTAAVACLMWFPALCRV